MLFMFTFGIYPIVWYVKTKEEMNAQGADIPTAWFLIIPILNIIWLWKYCQGVERVTRQSMSAGLTFALFVFLGPVGVVLAQINFNKVALNPG